MLWLSDITDNVDVKSIRNLVLVGFLISAIPFKTFERSLSYINSKRRFNALTQFTV